MACVAANGERGGALRAPPRTPALHVNPPSLASSSKVIALSLARNAGSILLHRTSQDRRD
jgi:hypothetical protein